MNILRFFQQVDRASAGIRAFRSGPHRLVRSRPFRALGRAGSMLRTGPTHQPVEHLAALRAIPDLTVIRPGDANETAVAWRVALETRDRPVALVLTRQAVPTLDRSRYAAADSLRSGAYVLSDAADGGPS